MTFDLPEQLEGGRWLNLTLSASKAGAQRFSETNRLGALVAAPAPQLVVSPRVQDLGAITAASTNQWHCIRLVNAGGGASVPWTLTGAGQGITFNLTNGNLRAEQEIYLQIDPAAFAAGEHAREIKIVGDGVAGDALRVRFHR